MSGIFGLIFGVSPLGGFLLIQCYSKQFYIVVSSFLDLTLFDYSFNVSLYITV